MILRHTGDFETHLFVWLVASGGFLVIMVGKRFFKTGSWAFGVLSLLKCCPDLVG